MTIGVPPVDVYAASAFSHYAAPAATADDMTVQTGAGTLRVRGVKRLTVQAVRGALADRPSLVQAGNALANAYEQAGWRNVLVVPVDTPGAPMLVVYEGGLSRVRGYAPLEAYFEPFVGQAPVEYSSFAIAARLAELHAARIGTDTDAIYARSVEQPQQVTMNLRGNLHPAPALDYQLRLGNEGNRFVGRVFGGVDLRWTAASSARLGLRYDRVLPELGDARGHPRYNGVSAFTDRVTRYGLFKLTASYADYQYRGIGVQSARLGAADTAPEFKATNLNIGAQAERFVYITPQWNWSAGVGLTYNDYDIEQVGTVAFAAERTSAAHVAGAGRWTASALPEAPQAYLNLQLRQALDTQFENTRAQHGFTLLSYGAGYAVAPFPVGRVYLSYEGQSSEQRLPQSEQWVLGGFDRLSAWLPGVAVGDRGSFAQLAYRVPLLDEPPHSLKVSASVERGTSAFADSSARLSSRLSSATLGLAYRYRRHWLLEGRVGRALEQHAPASFAIHDQEAAFYLRAARSFGVP